jgi:hypothetical protein
MDEEELRNKIEQLIILQDKIGMMVLGLEHIINSNMSAEQLQTEYGIIQSIFDVCKHRINSISI